MFCHSLRIRLTQSDCVRSRSGRMSDIVAWNISLSIFSFVFINLCNCSATCLNPTKHFNDTLTIIIIGVKADSEIIAKQASSEPPLPPQKKINKNNNKIIIANLSFSSSYSLDQTFTRLFSDSMQLLKLQRNIYPISTYHVVRKSPNLLGLVQVHDFTSRR